MRLAVLDTGHRKKQRAVLRLMQLVDGTVDPVAKLVMYRPAFFGRPFMALVEEVMRGPSSWSAGERELLAAYVSGLNSCPFCVGVHSGIAGINLGLEPSADPLESQTDPKLSAIKRLLEKANAPGGIAPGDVDHARAAGNSDEAITDALYVAFVFNVINRVANALGFDWESDRNRLKMARNLDRFHYHLPRTLLR